jgi:hypothetical protein
MKVPDDVQWIINPREDVLAMLREAEQQAIAA